MADPSTLSMAAIGAVALSEGVKFLYGQAGELLKRWRERRDNPKSTQPSVETTEVALPTVFEGELENPSIHYDALERAEVELRALYGDLTIYVNDVEPIDPSNEELLGRIDVLRRLLEAVYQQRITFKGEQRAASGPDIDVRIKVDEVLGYASVMRVRNFKAGRAVASGEFGKVAEHGKVVGFEAENIGE